MNEILVKDTLLKEIDLIINARDFSKAENLILDLLSDFPNDLMLWNKLAISQYKLHKYKESLDSFLKAYELGDNSTKLLNNIGTSLLALDRIHEALDYFLKCISSDKKFDIGYFNAANIYREINDYEKAYDYYKKACSINPKNKIYQNNLGLVCRLLKKENEAVEAFQRALYLDNNYSFALGNMGFIYHQRGEMEKAKDYLEKASMSDAENPIYKNILGTVYTNLGMSEHAVENFKKALTLLENVKNNNEKIDERLYRGVKTNLGNCYLSDGDFYTGLKLLEEGTGYYSIDKFKKNADEVKLPNPDKITSKNEPHFIGMWEFNNDILCKNIINLFEKRNDRHGQGEFGGAIQLDKKDTIDISVDIYELFGESEFSIAREYIDFVASCYLQYCEEWPFMKRFKNAKIGRFNFQKYHTGKHFLHIHSERMRLYECHRLFAFMTYLNDVEEGGETTFNHYDIKIKPKTGRTIIWPAEWTHAHAGLTVDAGVKYIATGWIEMH